jgi:outer membrane protein OmpA-like peptidoglycan-associated protein
MSDSVPDNDDLTPTQEYAISGVVILLFGLLYWFLNHGWNIGSDIDPAKAQLPQAELAMTADQGRAGLESPLPKAAVAASATTTKVVASHAPASVTPAPAVAATPAATLPTVAVTPAAVPQAAATVAATVPAKTVEPANPEAGPVGPASPPAAAATLPQAQTDGKPAPAEPVANEVYTLPDGTEVAVGTSGFEGAFRQAIANNEINKPITFDSITFDSGATQISAASEQQIKATAALLHQYPHIRILIRGHTDEVGLSRNNTELSLMRANAMGLALVNLGIDRQRLRIMGMGDSDPIGSNATEEGRRQNRRIDALIIQ